MLYQLGDLGVKNSDLNAASTEDAEKSANSTLDLVILLYTKVTKSAKRHNCGSDFVNFAFLVYKLWAIGISRTKAA